jgi:type I restriction enzyme S subunit
MLNEWSEIALDSALAVLIDYRGKSPPKSVNGVPVISAKVVKSGRITYPIEQTIDPAYYPIWMTRGFPQVGDIVMTTEGPMGEVAQLDSSNVKFALGQRVVCMRGKGGILDNTFFKFLLMSPAQQAILHSYATGTTVAGISQKALRLVPLKLPPFKQQVAIGRLLGALDDKIELNRRMNETLEAMARAIFKDWFVDFGPTRAKMEGQAPYLAPENWPLFPGRLDDEGKPEGWAKEPLLKHAHLLSGGTPKTAESAYWGGSIQWASAKDVSQSGELFLLETERSITVRGLEESSTRMIPSLSTVIVARGATTGRFCMFGSEIAMNQTCYALSTKAARPFWINCVFASLVDSIVHAAHGSVFDTITTRTIEGAMTIVSSTRNQS